MPRCLVAFDTDRIQDYVFATGTLRNIRGGSAVLDRLNRERMEQLAQNVDATFDPDTHAIYANGGAGLFVIEAGSTQHFIHQVRQAYRDATLTCSVTGVQADLPPDWTASQPIPEELAQLGYRLRCAKDAPAPLATRISHALLRSCDSCGTQYAQSLDSSRPQEHQWICRSCELKRAQNMDVKTVVRHLTGRPGAIDAQSRTLWHRLLTPFREALYDTPCDLPDDFNVLGELSQPKNYFGLIYADGDEMGRHLEACTSLPERKKFADTVDQALDQALIASIKKYLLPKSEKENTLRFDVLLAGGDDLVMVTTADTVLKVANVLAETFQKYTEERLGKTLTLSIGVVIAHAKFPFHNLYGLAKDLCKFAKKERVKRARVYPGAPKQGLINFQVVNAGNSLRFREEFTQVFVQEDRQLSGPPLKYVRTLRPYYVDHAEDLRTMPNLLDQVERLRAENFPRTKLQQLRELAWLPYGEAVLQGKALQNRLKKHERKLLREVIQAFVPPEALHIDTLPWFQQGENTSFTPFVDLVELYDFLSGGGA